MHQDGDDLAEGDDDEPRLCGSSQPPGHFPVVPDPPGVCDVFQGRGMDGCPRLLMSRNTDLPI